MKKKNLIDLKILPFLKKNLPSEKLTHVLGVMDLSEKLAVKHHMNPYRARLTASLHDMVRHWNEKKLLEYIKKHHLKIPHKKFICQHQPVLLHGFVAADLASKLFHVRDRQVLSAITKHSFASMQMTPFEKLIYLADLLAPDRNFPEVSQLRFLAFKDLQKTFVEGLRVKMMYLLKEKQCFHPNSVRVWNHFISHASTTI